MVMSDGYQGLGSEERNGCLAAAIAGIVTFVILDLGRVLGDPAPGTEDAWWRHIPFFVPTLIVVSVTFFIVRALSKPDKPDGS